MSKKIPIVFFGTGPVAAKSLGLLLESFDVVAVVTKPKPPHHRGSFPVLEVAEKHKIPVHTVSNKRELSRLISTKPFQTEIAVLIDFGIIVSQDVIDYFKKGIVNSHFSLLPEWRGADPITFAILSGQKKTGVSLMLLVEAMDEGAILSVGEQPLNGTETTPTLTEKLIYLSDALLKNEIPRHIAGETKGVDQLKMSELIPSYPAKPTYSRKLTKQDGILDFTKPAQELEREIRAFIDWPKSRTKLGDIDVIITKAHAVPSHPPESKPGDITIVEEVGEIGIATANGTLWIDQLKPAGKKEMSAGEFLRGYGNRL